MREFASKVIHSQKTAPSVIGFISALVLMIIADVYGGKGYGERIAVIETKVTSIEFTVERIEKTLEKEKLLMTADYRL